MWGKIRDQLRVTIHQADIILAVAVIGIILLLILPLPPFLLDLFLCLNLVFSVMVLLLTLYVKQALEFSAFPAALLFLTLYRLGLNIASTRMILSRGEGGDIIRTFGEFVTEGHVTVGLILFALLTTINFIVVTKGAGRVAEVAARFNLEALPGKQMSIDGELSAGLIGQDEAKLQHQKVQQEAEFYGAMDGASKFVRGDAIAGILMICVNIIGGLAVGVFIKGFSFSQSWNLFTKLTVGDGLVSQIPALLVSVGAGIMVTRCSAQSLGEALNQQLFHHPKVLAMTGMTLLFLGFIPGMPLLVMWPIAACLLVYAWVLGKETIEKGEQASTSMGGIEVEVGANLAKRVVQVKEQIQHQLKELERDLGIRLPPLAIRDNLKLAPSICEITIAGALAERERVSLEDLAHKITQVVSSHCHEFLCRQDVSRMIEQARKVDAAVVNELIPKKISLGEVLAILQNLLKEGISINNFTAILESLADTLSQGGDKDCDALTQKVRERLSRGISDHFFGIPRTAYVITLDPKIEKMIEVAISDQFSTQQRLRPHVIENIANQLRVLQFKGKECGGRAVVVTESNLRARLKRLIERNLPDLPVLAYSELAHDVKLQPIGMVTKEALLP